MENKNTQIEPVEAWKTVSLNDVMYIASNALVIMEEFVAKLDEEDDLSPEVQSSYDEMKHLVNEPISKQYITLDSNFDLDLHEIILENTENKQVEELKAELKEAESHRQDTLKFFAQIAELAEYTHKANNIITKLGSDIELHLADDNFWVANAILKDLHVASDILKKLSLNEE